MFRKWFSLIVLSCFLSSPLLAFLHPGPCEWVVEGEFLYLLPSVDDTFFVAQGVFDDTAFIDGERFGNDFKFHPGFRVGAGRGLGCDREVQFHYTRFRESHTRTISGDSLFATMGTPELVDVFDDYIGFAQSDLDLLYQQYQLSFGYQFLNGWLPFKIIYRGWH